MNLDEKPSGIIGVQDSGFKVQGDDVWFDLNGRKLNTQPTKPGLYIKGGKKVYIQ